MKDNEELLKMLRKEGYDIDRILDLDDTFNFKCQRCGSCFDTPTVKTVGFLALKFVRKGEIF